MPHKKINSIKKRGRRKGTPVRFKGLADFCRLKERSQNHVYRVLNGDRESPLRNEYWAWRKKREAIKP